MYVAKPFFGNNSIPRKLFPPEAIVTLAKPVFMEKESNFSFIGTLKFLLSPRLPLKLFFCLDI